MKENEKNTTKTTTFRIYQKINFNEMSDCLFNIVSKSKSEFARENGFNLAVQYQIFTNYLAHITKHAIEENDKITLFILNQIGILTNVKDEEIQEWQIKYSEFVDKIKNTEEVSENE